MDRLVGTVSPVSTDKKITSVQVTVKVNQQGFKVSDIQLQSCAGNSQYNCAVCEQFADISEEMHFNFVARGGTTVIVPYMSELPHVSSGTILPCESNYITTPMKVDLLVHKKFAKSDELLWFGTGVTGQAKRIELNSDVDAYTHVVYDGYTSQKYIGAVEQKGTEIIGRELRLANADSKFTLLQNNKRKSTGVLYAKKTRKGV